MALSLLEMLEAAAKKPTITKKEFGEQMHSFDLTDDQKRAIAKQVEELGGYENLGD